jgi:cell filamentation protein
LYDAFNDPYCYAGTEVLKNRLGIRDLVALEAFETDATAQRFAEPLPTGRFSANHYCRIHHHIFRDVYPWAGRYRRVRIAKGNSMFCYPEHIGSEMQRIFAGLPAQKHLKGLNADSFSHKIAHFLAELNAIHPFRDGNGRTQLAFIAVLGEATDHPIGLERLEPEPFLSAMIESFQGREEQLVDQLVQLIS